MWVIDTHLLYIEHARWIQCVRSSKSRLYYATKIAQLMKLKLSFRSICAMHFLFHPLSKKKKALVNCMLHPYWAANKHFTTFWANVDRRHTLKAMQSAYTAYTHTPLIFSACGRICSRQCVTRMSHQDHRHQTLQTFTLLYNFLAGYRSKTMANKCLCTFSEV